MRISDWSSDVCSSDLKLGRNIAPRILEQRNEIIRCVADQRVLKVDQPLLCPMARIAQQHDVFRMIVAQHRHSGPLARHQRLQGFRKGPRESLCIRSEEHTSELQSLMRMSYAILRRQKKKQTHKQ